MKVTGIWVYPIKGLCGIPLHNARLGPSGVQHDRRFMLFKVKENGDLQKLQLDKFPACSRFVPDIVDDEIHVRYMPPEVPLVPSCPEQNVLLRVPLNPDLSRLEKQAINLHQALVNAYRMGDSFDKWFTACFGFETIFFYIGDERRPVLGTYSPRSQPLVAAAPPTQGWIPYLYNYVWGGREQQQAESKPEPDWLTFSDMAAYLVVTEKSLRNVNARFSNTNNAVEIVKFRPNIVVDGEVDFDEDFWAELSINGRPVLALTKLCDRCTSLNVDYDTGRFGEGEKGSLLKKLMADRRVDKGAKWEPVFGKYAFLVDGLHGADVSVGDDVAVTKRTAERPAADWPFADKTIARFYRYS
ncbi:MOSC domain-containing protein [Trichoderma sp. SZMC 28014]